MDFGFFTDDRLFDFFCRNKTKMSTIEEPLMFLRHLKDNRLITDELYQRLEDTGDDNGVYCALDYFEKHGKKNVRKFWQCVDQEHILQRYSQLSEVTVALKNSLKSQPNRKIRERAEERGTGKEREIKKRRTESNSVSDQAGPSSQSPNSQKTTDKHVKRELQSPPDSSTQESFFCPSLHRKAEDLWNMPKHARWLPVTCGNEKALLDREALNNTPIYCTESTGKRDCIKCGRAMISPYIFEKIGGKESCKSWKTSILCQGTTLKSLMEMNILKIPELDGKFTLRK